MSSNSGRIMTEWMDQGMRGGLDRAQEGLQVIEQAWRSNADFMKRAFDTGRSCIGLGTKAQQLTLAALDNFRRQVDAVIGFNMQIAGWWSRWADMAWTSAESFTGAAASEVSARTEEVRKKVEKAEK